MSNTLRLDGDRPAFPILEQDLLYTGSISYYSGTAVFAEKLCPCWRCATGETDPRFVVRTVDGERLIHVRQSSLAPLS